MASLRLFEYFLLLHAIITRGDLSCGEYDKTVGTGGDFADLGAALRTVPDDTVLMVLDGTYTVASTVEISRRVLVCGQSRAGTIVTTAGLESDPLAVFSIVQSGVGIQRLTIKQLTPNAISADAAITVYNATDATVQVSNFTLRDTTVEYVSRGLSVRGANLTVVDSSLTFTLASSIAARLAIRIYGISGIVNVSNNIATSLATGGSQRFLVVSVSTATAIPSEVNKGTLIVRNNTLTGNVVYSTNSYNMFAYVNNFQGNPGDLNIIFDNNTLSNGVNFLGLAVPTNFSGDVFGQISMTNNVIADGTLHGSFLISIYYGGSGDAPSNLWFRSAKPLKVFATGNTYIGGSGFKSYKNSPGSNPFGLVGSHTTLSKGLNVNVINSPNPCDSNFTVSVASSGADFASLDSAVSMAPEGSTILVMNGTYMNPRQLVIAKQLTVCGESTYGTILKSSTNMTSIVGVSADGVKITRMTIRHVAADTDTSAIAIDVGDPSNPLRSISNFVLTDSVIEFKTVGVAIRGSNPIIQNNNITFYFSGMSSSVFSKSA